MMLWWRAELCGEHDLLYPGVVVTHLDVDPGHVSLATAHPPAHDAGQLPEAADLADQGAPAVSLAGVLALLTTSTEEPGVEQELTAQPGPSQSLLALTVGHDGDVHLLQDVLVGAGQSELVLPPPTHPAPVAREILQ